MTLIYKDPLFSSKLVLIKGTNVFLMFLPDVFHKISADFADEDAI